MTKTELLGIYRTKLNHIQLTYASLVLWSYPDTINYFQTLEKELTKTPILFPDIHEFLNNEEALTIACEELYDSAHRSSVNELLSFTKQYCYKTDQLTILKEQSWFKFWRILRNNWAHEMTFNFSKDEKKLLPVEWSGIIIDISMNHKHLTYGQCSREKLRELISTAELFIKKQLV